ncbi:MAG: hypothetical protein ACRCX8_20330 [Sarcina sp.]
MINKTVTEITIENESKLYKLKMSFSESDEEISLGNNESVFSHLLEIDLFSTLKINFNKTETWNHPASADIFFPNSIALDELDYFIEKVIEKEGNEISDAVIYCLYLEMIVLEAIGLIDDYREGGYFEENKNKRKYNKRGFKKSILGRIRNLF